MKLKHLLAGAIAAAATLAGPAAFAQSHPQFVAQGRITAALYMPDSGPKPHVIFLVSHRTGNNLNNVACPELAKRGFAALCWNTRFQNNEAGVHWEDIGADVKTAMDYARSVPGITKVIQIAHSGGSPLATYYQAVAENGPGWCQGADKLVQCAGGAAMTGWKPADGMVYPDAHPGNGVQLLRGINASLTIKDGKVVVDPALDPFDPKNGFNPNGPSHYSADFQKKYYAAQSVMMNGLIAKAQKMQADMKAGNGSYPDEDVFVVPFGAQFGAAGLSIVDPDNALNVTKRPEKLLKNDGTIVTQIVHSVLVAEPDYAKTNRTFEDGANVLTTQSFLSGNAVKSTDSMDGIDHCSSNNSTVCGVASIRAPTLIAAMGGWRFVRAQEEMYDMSPAKDKDYIVIEGALHVYNPCKACEKTPGQYSNTTKNLFDYIAKWTNERF